MIRDITVHVQGTSAGELRLAYAFDLAERQRARLTAVHVAAPGRAGGRERAVAGTLFAGAAHERLTPARFVAEEGELVEALARAARFSDLLILGDGDRGAPPGELARAVAARAGVPVLVVPDETTSFGPSRRALLVWSGGPGAVRAIHDAIPLLASTNMRVELALVGQESWETKDALIDHLARHRVAVESPAHVLAATNGLASRLAAGDFDLLVMQAGAPWTAPSSAQTPTLIAS
ncbi:MAG TPA: universal stress protein [Caulobacteraceae bacterium]|nr:universal stress protein [Caulobacteraceae bacterium]